MEIPTISILAVTKDETVTIQAANYPADTKFDVLMDKAGTLAVDGILVETLNSRKGGSFTITFDIPEKLRGEKQIAIRLESKSGFYSYNWFDNTTFAPATTDALATEVEYVRARQDLSIRNGPAKKYPVIGELDEGEIISVTGVSLDGKGGACSAPMVRWAAAGYLQSPRSPDRWIYRVNNFYKTVVYEGITMKTRTAIVFAMLFVLLLNACSPFTITSSSGEQPAPVIETTSAPTTGYQPVDVDQVEAGVGVGSPIPVQVTVSGNLPDTCAQIELVQQRQEGSSFQITLSTIPSKAEGCVQDTLPFRMVIPLNTVNLPGGSYSVEVNGSRTDFEMNTGNTTSTLPSADSVITKEDVQVDSVNVEVGVGSPIPVHAGVALRLPNSCAQLGEILLHREGTVFYVRLIADITERPDCIIDSIPFRLEVPLNIVNLPPGPYEVNVNGVSASFDPNAMPAVDTDLADFESQLQAALTQRDAEAMRALMGEQFIMAYWQSEGESLPADEALTQLLNNHVPQNNVFIFQEFQNIPGFDAQSFVGPDVELAKAVYVTGWGMDGMGQALLFISRRPEGSLFWQGVLVTPRGFAPPMGQVCSEPAEVPVVDGRASYNGISFSIDPALNYGMAARICPAATMDPQGWNEVHPPYTEFFFPTYSRANVDYQPSLRVYEVEGNLEDYFFPINSLDELQATLEQRPEPVSWFQHSPLHTRQAYLDFANGAGVRGLIQYMQDFFFFTNNGLIYEFHGLTEDGRHFIDVRYPVSVPFLMELDGITLPPNNVSPQAIFVSEWPSDFEQQRQVIEAYNNEALQRFKQMSESETFPNIALLDQLVQSIEVSQP